MVTKNYLRLFLFLFVFLLGVVLVSSFSVSDAVYSQSFDVSSQDGMPHGMTFSNDGNKVFVAGDGGNAIYEYGVNYVFNITSTIYLQSFSVSSQENMPTDVVFNNDGSKMYVVGYMGDKIYEYDLMENFNISEVVYSHKSFDVSHQDGGPMGMTFNNDGSKMYVLGDVGSSIYEYNLSDNFNITSAMYFQSFSVSSQENMPTDLAFNNDGSKMYVVGAGGGFVYEYNLSDNFNVISAVYSQSFDVSSQDAFPTGLTFNNDGSKMYIIGLGGDKIYEYDIESSEEESISRLFIDNIIDNGKNLTILLNLSVYDSSFYVIDEVIPSAWEIIDNGGADTSEANHLKWVIIQDAEDVVYNYTLRVPENISGQYNFSGTCMFENDIEEQNVNGDISIIVNLVQESSSGDSDSSDSSKKSSSDRKGSNVQVTYGNASSINFSKDSNFPIKISKEDIDNSKEYLLFFSLILFIIFMVCYLFLRK